MPEAGEIRQAANPPPPCPLHGAMKISLLSRLWTIMFTVRSDRAQILAHHFLRVLSQLLAPGIIPKQAGQRLFQPRRVRHLYRGILREKTAHHFGKVLHVRTNTIAGPMPPARWDSVRPGPSGSCLRKCPSPQNPKTPKPPNYFYYEI